MVDVEAIFLALTAIQYGWPRFLRSLSKVNTLAIERRSWMGRGKRCEPLRAFDPIGQDETEARSDVRPSSFYTLDKAVAAQDTAVAGR